MLHFFRRIRYRLASDNQFLKYSRYAIGEIFLVMIGILLALQVNNWNESRKKEQAEIELYHQILADLKSERGVIETKIFTFKHHQNLHFQLYDETRGKAEFDPTTSYKHLYTYSPVSLFFDENHSKSLALISDKETHNLLKEYIDLEKIVTRGNEDWNKVKTEEVRPFLARHGIKNTDAVFHIESSDDWPSVAYTSLVSYPKLVEQFGSEEFDQLLYELRIYTTWTLYNYKLLKEINQELEAFLQNKIGIEKSTENEGFTPVVLEVLLEDKTVEEIIEIVRSEDPDNPRVDISEIGINRLGYSLITDRRLTEAKSIFELGIEIYPEAYNLYDSYGECLIKLKDYENAAKAFKKALELNPQSYNSERLLEYLETREKKLL